MSKEAALNMMSQTTPTPSTEAPVVTPQEPAKPTVDSDRFAALTAKEIKLQKERELLKQEKEQLKPVWEKWQKFEETKKTDKIEALKLMGFTEEDILNFVANAPEKKEPTPAEIAAQAAREEIEKDRKAREDKELQLQKERDEKNIKAFKEGIGETIKKETEKFEYLNHYGEVAQELVYETILEFMKEDPELTPYDALKEALDSVEDYYAEENTKLLNLNKFKSKLPKPEEKPVQEAVKKPLQPATKPVAPTPPVKPETTPQTSTRKETREEKKERLARMLSGG